MKSNFIVFLCTVLLCVFDFHLVSGLKCYECHYNSMLPDSPVDCLNPDSNPTYLRECPPHAAGEPFCHTSIHYLTLGEEVRLYVDRSCHGGPVKQWGCVEFHHPEQRVSKPLSAIKDCTCKTDQCNGEIVSQPENLHSCAITNYRGVMDSIYLFTAALAYRF